jgi:hypothetical protein
MSSPRVGRASAPAYSVSQKRSYGEVEIDSAIANGTGEPGRAGADIALRQIEPFIRNGVPLQTGKPFERDFFLRGYARRRNSAARTRSRNCSGVSVDRAEAGAGFGFTMAGAAASAAFFAALRAASCASCLVAKSFASASTVSAGEPSRAMRWS